jgi:phage tail-like protein
MTVQGEPRRYDKKFLFGIEIAGLEVAHFETMSELSGEVGVVEQHEGGMANVADQSPGKLKFNTVTLTIGATDNQELYNWWLQVIDAASNSGEIDEEYKRTVNLVQKDRNGTEKRRFKLFKAWPMKYVAGEWDAKAEENVIESIELVYLRFERVNAAA